MTAGRGDRAAPPAPEGHWEVRFADAASAKGWESLAQQARENTYRAWLTMRTTSRPATETPRHHRLKGGLAHGIHQRTDLRPSQAPGTREPQIDAETTQQGGRRNEPASINRYLEQPQGDCENDKDPDRSP